MSDLLDTSKGPGGPPDAFGSFRALHQVGEGTLGPVFRAYDAELERLVAVKLFTVDLEPVRVDQLVAEFEQLIVADLNHPVIGRVLATGVCRGSAYIVQEHIAADSLDVVVRQYGRAPTADVLRVAAQVAGALDFAAVVNFYHGALHSRDVLLSADETRLTGIGIAQALRRVGIAVPVRRPYTAPELWRDSPIDRRADVFSLAVVVHELLGGPRSAAPPNAIELRTEIPDCDVAALRKVFDCALDKDPSNRFSTALQFVDALTSVLSGSERPVGSPQALKSPPAPTRRLQPVQYAQIDTPPDHDAIDEFRRPVLAISPPQPSPARGEHSRWSARLPRRAKPVSARERRRASASQLLLALVVGLAVGAADRYRVGWHDLAPPRAAPSDRDSGALTQSLKSHDTDPDERQSATQSLKSHDTDPGERQPATQSLKSHDTDPGERQSADATEAATTPQPTAPDVNRASLSSTPAGEGDTPPRRQAPSVPSGHKDRLAGMLFVDSHPRGATLFLDEKMIGTTPVALSAIPAGEHTIRLESDGYPAWSASVHVAPDQLNRVRVSLDR